MPKISERVERKSKYDRFTKPMIRNDSYERFSSFETPPPSDNEEEELSDFQSSIVEINLSKTDPSPSKKKRSHILIEDMPLQCDKSSSHRKKKEITNKEKESVCRISNQENYQRRPASQLKEMEGKKAKENCQPRYNYLHQIEKQLTTIQQDLRESNYSLLPRAPSFSLINSRGGNELQRQFIKNSLENVYIQQQRIKITVLQQQNLMLQERVIRLEGELRLREEERLCREAEETAHRMAIATHEQLFNSTRKEVRLKQIEQITSLQNRCQEMKDEMKRYKQKQEEIFSKLCQEKQKQRQDAKMIKMNREYQNKFIEVFLNMVEKLPIELEEQWSRKKKIAVGWKVVKHLLKKALKLGIQLPSIIVREHIDD